MPGIPARTSSNFGWLQWLATWHPYVGAALIVLLVGRGQQLFLQVLYLSSGRWMFEQPPSLIILALIPAGRISPGRAPAPQPDLRRWP